MEELVSLKELFDFFGSLFGLLKWGKKLGVENIPKAE
jgi:hypothetical protein